jgi:hypothetical protein
MRRSLGQRSRVAAGVLASLLPSPAGAWGPVAHQAAVSKAIDTLPGGLKPFYKNHRLEMPTLSLEATLPEEGPDRRFAADRFMPFPFGELPHTEGELRTRFAETADQAGRLPWLIHDSYARLVEAFRSTDKTRILTESDTLAGLVTDLHNPLALTENSDGQKTGQHGLWVRLSVRFPEVLEKRLKLDPDAAHFLDDPKEHVFSMISGNYVWLDNLLYQEDLAHRGKTGYTEIYYEALELRAGDIVRDRLSQAAGESGSYWYTAWTAAGRPALK